MLPKQLNYFLNTIGILLLSSSLLAQEKKPNIILLFSDDAGYADFGFQGSKVMITPNLDKLAKEGVRFTEGYVSASTCGPSRAGMLTGKYQQRFGFEENNVPGFMSKVSSQKGAEMGIPINEKLMGDYMKSLNYKTAYFGKWHIGGTDELHPLKRGFDEFYGFRGGARSYYPYKKRPKELNKLERDFSNFKEHEGYLTDKLGEDAAQFIERNKNNPFFAIVAFNAVHKPMEATEEDLKKFPNLEGHRKTVAAMTLGLDRACGKILDKVKELGLEKNTIIVFANDNGGPSDINASVNLPLSGTKSNQLEGGIRVPFLMKWPKEIKKKSLYNQPISTLDLLPTFFIAGGGKQEDLKDIDGVNILPHIKGTIKKAPHEMLFWKKDVRAAIRKGDWKLIRYPDRPAELFNIKQDIAEQTNLATKYPEKVRTMYKDIFKWESTLERPRWLLKRKYENLDIDRMDVYR